MGIRSMTGYGAGQAGTDRVVRVQMHSVNHRYASIEIKLPWEYTCLEDIVRRLVTSEIRRGRVEVVITVEDLQEKTRTVKINWGLLQGYHQALQQIESRLGIRPQKWGDFLLSLQGVLEPEGEDDREVDSLLPLVEEAVKQALNALIRMRREEGRRLTGDLMACLDGFAHWIDRIAKRAPLVPEEYRERLRIRIQELLQEVPVKEEHIATEVAIFADRCNIDEELVRSRSHIAEFRQTLQSDGPVGRKLEFLIQEMNREVNTIGSKANDAEISRWVVEAKSELEKLREQVQNVE